MLTSHAGSAVYLYTVTTPTSTGAFNITVDGGITWQTVYPNVTSSAYAADQLTWAYSGLDPSKPTNLVLRFWHNAPGTASESSSGLGPELNIQSFVVTSPQDQR